MATQVSFIKINGTLGGLTFYKSANGDLIRTTGRVPKSRILNDPVYARTRENMSEFKNIAVSGKYLRMALAALLKKATDNTVNRRLFTVLGKVKNLDVTSPRGSRQVAIGAATPAGQAMFKGFDFNSKATLTTVLHAPFTMAIGTGEVDIVNFNPLTELIIPGGATDVSFTAAVGIIDFTTGIYSLSQSPSVNLSVTAQPQDISLTVAPLPDGTGIKMLLLLIEFFQEVNGTQYPLNNGNFNVLTTLDAVSE